MNTVPITAVIDPNTAPTIVEIMFEDDDDDSGGGLPVVDPSCVPGGGGWAGDGGALLVLEPLVNVTPVVDVRPCSFNSVTREAESVAASKSSCEPTEDATASFKTSTTNSTSTPTTVCMSRRRLEVASTFVTLITRTFVGLVEMRLAIAATKATFSASMKLSSV
jgi:hypothetical protein